MALTSSQQALCAMLFGATVSGVGTGVVVKKQARAEAAREASIIAPAPPSRTVHTASGGSVTIYDAPVLGNCIKPEFPEAFEVPELRQPYPPLTPISVGPPELIQIVSRVPEPDTWTMLVAGFGFVGLSVRRSKKKEFI